MSDYSQLDRFLHYLALEYPFLGELGFDLERIIFKPSESGPRALYVTGLARSGTTALMRALYSSGQFASLTYNDMPFVMAPNLWGKVSGLYAKKRIIKERAHGDGVYVDFDAPEALEEVFWRLRCARDYISPDALRTHSVESETIKELHTYQKLICKKYGRPRYLAKNNNHIIRLASLAEQTKESTYLVVFRNPVDHASSLLKQHQRFREADAFTKKYMIWLAHHEFGATHRPFKFSESSMIDGSPDQLDYWVKRWIDAYTYLLCLLKKKFSNLIPVSYERLCADSQYWLDLCEKVDLPETPSSFRGVMKHDTPLQGNAHLESAMSIYRSWISLLAGNR